MIRREVLDLTGLLDENITVRKMQIFVYEYGIMASKSSIYPNFQLSIIGNG